MERAPDEERPANPVATAAEQHHYQRVDVVPALPLAGAGQGKVEVGGEPVREGDVPALPELLDGGGPVGAVEVSGI